MPLLWPWESRATCWSPRPNPTLLPGVIACSSHWVLPRLGLVRHCYVGWRRRKVTMDERDWLAERFQAHRSHLRAVAYRMLGSLTEADDAVQGAWLRLSRSRTDTSEVHNLGGWLTTLVARECLDMLRARISRREEPLGVHLPDPIISPQDQTDPEQQALLAEGVGLALLVVLDTLAPAERLAFVLHDMFAVPFDQIGPIVGRSPDAAKMLASRARRRVQGAAPVPDADLARQREVVDAFFAAARDGRLRAAWAGATGAGQRRRRGGAGRRGPAVCGRGFHGQGWEDRRDRHPRRPRTAPSARPSGPRPLTSQPTLPLGSASGVADRSAPAQSAWPGCQRPGQRRSVSSVGGGGAGCRRPSSREARVHDRGPVPLPAPAGCHHLPRGHPRDQRRAGADRHRQRPGRAGVAAAPKRPVRPRGHHPGRRGRPAQRRRPGPAG